MKKILLLMVACTVLMLAFKPQKASGQVTGYTLGTVVDTLGPQCSFPQFRNFYFFVNVAGTYTATDSFTVHVNWEDASDTTFRVRIMSPFGLQMYHNYYYSGTFGVQVSLVPDNGVADTVYGLNLVASDTCGNLSGRLYVDNNANCTYDAGDVPHVSEFVKITNVNNNAVFYAFTDVNGMYYMSLPANQTYTVQDAYIYGGYTPSCPANGVQTVAIGQGNYVEDLAYSCANATNIDMYVGASALNYRPNTNRYTNMEAFTNNMCTTIPATVTMTLDPMLTYAFTVNGTPPTTVAGNVLTWNVAALGSFPYLAPNMYMHTSPLAVAGDTLCSTVTITTTAAVTDPNLANNTYTVCAPVVNSCDPNEKAVWPKGVGAPGYVANGTNLHYFVEFQNTGSDTAYNVTIIDILDSDLDINTLQIEKSSFSPKVSIMNGQVLIFKLDGINLPDSGVNQNGSQGYVSYSIKPKSNLAQGTQIRDKADIYFDFNEAVPTNAPLNTINDALAVKQLSNSSANASVYPNPAENEFTVRSAGGFTVTMYDMLGRSITSQNSVDSARINTTNIAAGIYTLKIKNADGEQAIKVSVQH